MACSGRFLARSSDRDVGDHVGRNAVNYQRLRKAYGLQRPLSFSRMQ